MNAGTKPVSVEGASGRTGLEDAFRLVLSVLLLAVAVWAGCSGVGDRTTLLVWDPLAAACLVSLFVIFHDCAHRSFSRNRMINELTGGLCGLLLFTPLLAWRRRHLLHHSCSSNLDRRGWWDYPLLTTEEYTEMSRSRLVGYRIARSPLIAFVIAPPVFFLAVQRFPGPKPGASERLSVHATTIGAVLLVLTLVWTFGGWRTALVLGPAFWLATATGFVIFHLQHVFPGGQCMRNEEWSWRAAGLEGSACFGQSPAARLVIGNLGYHQAHHLEPRLSNRHLSRHRRDFGQLHGQRLMAGEMLVALRLTLWDETRRRYVPWPARSTP